MTIIDNLKAQCTAHYAHYQDGLITERECLLKCMWDCETAVENLCNVDAAQVELDLVGDMLKGYMMGIEYAMEHGIA